MTSVGRLVQPVKKNNTNIFWAIRILVKTIQLTMIINIIMLAALLNRNNEEEVSFKIGLYKH